MIRIDAPWLAVEPIDMRAGSERLLARVVQVFGAAQAHRRRYDELLRNQRGSTVAPEALRRIAQIYRLERELASLSSEQRLVRRYSDAKPLWEELHAWLQLERSRVPDGGITAKALDYSLKNWAALTHHLLDGEVSVDNNSLEKKGSTRNSGERRLDL
ncbi:Transposase [Cupriavidus necator]|uniref:Transposase IS66 central domain-containing protein n=1 Tax=Cupriavidus necator (strain ATCC 17699 / DSM 428 / KCTC 22496 / NCIMB 10442 / H16 / Stanier 337) TaxID=381666 RepID=A0AAE6DG47_CUPNH|nr:transposase [Cupriavidus necator]QCC00762.1 hypothetical protein E6A55_09160 [Cupriavidus necator H16]QQB76413.1 transposase [Cupriavidus necator]WKA42645.1 transposase [Cupriavidus necator]